MYLLTFDGFPEDKEALLRFLDARPEVADWHTSMTNAVFVVTELGARNLLDLLRGGPVNGFILVEIRPEDYDRTVAGWLPKATWEFIERKAAERKVVAGR